MNKPIIELTTANEAVTRKPIEPGIVLEDENGNRLTHDERKITVEVEGAGTFLAVGSGNPCTEDQITAKNCHLYRGTAIIILKSKEKGDTRITVKASGVKDGICTVIAE